MASKNTDYGDAIGFGLIVLLVLGIILFFWSLMTAPDYDEWEKIDNAGTCYVHHHTDSRWLTGTHAETRVTYCKKEGQ